LISPNGVELINFLVLLDRELGQGGDEGLGCLGILLGLEAVVFYLLLSILLGLVCMRLFLNFWREYSWRGEDFIEVLELLSGLVLIRVGNNLSIDFGNIWESIDDESS
jgi:hypothetical protein